MLRPIGNILASQGFGIVSLELVVQQHYTVNSHNLIPSTAMSGNMLDATTSPNISTAV